MQNKILIICLILSQLFVSVFTAPGTAVTCTQTGSTCSAACRTPTVTGGTGGSCSWSAGNILYNCSVADCTCLNSGTVTGLDDTFCQSCKGTNSKSFANSNGSACVATFASCSTSARGSTPWSVGDCTLCTPSTPALVDGVCTNCGSISSGWTDYNCNACATTGALPTQNIYANTALTSCVASSASCTNRGSTAWTAADCTMCTPSTPALVSGTCTACYDINSGWTDENCNACASPGSKAVFANTAGSSCVAAQYSCKPTTRGTKKWTDADCGLCNGTTTNAAQYASADGSMCVAASASCINRGSTAWNAGDCTLCTPATPILVGNTCTDCASINSGWTDAICNLCAQITKTKTNFANGTGTSCVASSYSCNKNARGSNKWTDADCAACNGTGSNANQYASVDGSACQAKQISASSTSTFSGQIFVSILLVLSALLI